MNTMTYSRTAASGNDAGWGQRLKSLWQGRSDRFVPLTAIVLGHVALFYLMESGMLSRVAHAVTPQVVNITFVAAPEPLKPAPQPKTVQVAQRTPDFTPPPLVSLPQTEATITVPQQPVRASEPAAIAVATPAVAPAPQPAAPSTPKTIAGAEYLRAPQAVYPSISRRMGETGVVMLRVLIGEKGLPEQVVVQKSSGSANLDEAGRQSVLRALFKPYIEDGKAVPVYVLVPINFQIS